MFIPLHCCDQSSVLLTPIFYFYLLARSSPLMSDEPITSKRGLNILTITEIIRSFIYLRSLFALSSPVLSITPSPPFEMPPADQTTIKETNELHSLLSPTLPNNSFKVILLESWPVHLGSRSDLQLTSATGTKRTYLLQKKPSPNKIPPPPSRTREAPVRQLDTGQLEELGNGQRVIHGIDGVQVHVETVRRICETEESGAYVQQREPDLMCGVDLHSPADTLMGQWTTGSGSCSLMKIWSVASVPLVGSTTTATASTDVCCLIRCPTPQSGGGTMAIWMHHSFRTRRL